MTWLIVGGVLLAVIAIVYGIIILISRSHPL